MKRIYTDADPVRAGYVASLVEAAGIDCTVRNRYLGGGAGELPVNECWPEVWVLDEADASAALRIVHAALEPRTEGEPWVCPRCGEGLEPQFETCWQCGTARGA